MRPKITKQNIKTLLETKFIKVFDLQYAEGRHYYNATRRSADDLVAVKSTEEFQNMLPDAVSCITIWNPSNGEPKLLLNREFRYPAGQFLLSVPAGLIDPADKVEDEPLLVTAKRELKEETGMDATLVNPRFITGVDEALLEDLKRDHTLVVTLEDGVLDGGFGEKIARYYGASGMKVLNYGIRKEFADRYDAGELLRDNRLTAPQIVEDIKKVR